jgi:hypothetical protein
MEINFWMVGERALTKAEPQIVQYKQKVHELNGSVKIIRGKIASGEPWPGTQPGNQVEARQHNA